MRVVGLDIGEKRIGVAVSDPAERVATPLVVLEAARADKLTAVLEDYEAKLIVVGLPVSLAGTEGPQAARIRAFAEGLTARTGIPVEYYDERLTSTEAKRVMSAVGVDSKAARGSVDMVAAAILLQSFLDSRRKPEV